MVTTRHRTGAILLCMILGALLAPACDVLGVGGGCDTSGGGAGGGGGAVPAAGCTPSRTCLDMFEACQDKGYPCTREIEYKKTLCEYCRDDCKKDRPYKYSECYKCGFSDP